MPRNDIETVLNDFVDALDVFSVGIISRAPDIVPFYIPKADFLITAKDVGLDVETVFGNVRHNNAPKLLDFLTYANNSDALIGYVVPHGDSKIAIVGIETRDGEVVCKLIRAARSCPDEFTIVDGRTFHLWWD